MAIALTTGTGTAAAEPGPSDREVTESKKAVRERAAAVGRVKARLAQATGELERISAAAALAMERYNGELVKLEHARQAYENSQRRLGEAEQRYRQIRDEAAVFAAAAYRAGTGVNQWAATVAGRTGPQNFMDRAALMEVLGHRQAGMVERVRAARIIADMFRRQTRTALQDRQVATERAESAKSAAERLLAAQREELKRIKARKTILVARLGRARAHAAEVQQAREQARSAGFHGGVGRGSIVVRAALKWLGTPYSWGGGTVTGPSYGVAHGANIRGFDCSGLALHAWNKAGVRLDHWTGTQWTSGPHVPTGRLRPGDLVFFANDASDPSTIHHVGIYIGRGLMVEAPYTGGRVRVSSIWRAGLIGATRPAG
ncbi:NlpC/P60 family protein [Actinomadura sp. HBU206391]|uniref:NlpC/P60 family protein n=1 Tax=Actinomadura sp. HBU206391 TaxID=2731692 RepID=UPI00164F3DA2|nr:NlpC/P60 family protein [Actinomadura sp. HBU206391]MBC6458871.1 C40 family peptidase [Actinomadura sp. HBU206391]